MLVTAAVAEAGATLYDLELSGHTLRVFIQSDAGVTIDTCTQVSRVLSDRLDQADPLPGRYFLEVSSPGVERKLRGIEDFERETGKYAHVVTSRGGLDGIIRNVDAKTVTLAVAEAAGDVVEMTLPVGEIKRANLRLSDRDLFRSHASSPKLKRLKDSKVVPEGAAVHQKSEKEIT